MQTGFGGAELRAYQSKRFSDDFFAGEAQLIVYILASHSRGKAPERIALIPVRIISVRHKKKASVEAEAFASEL